MFKATLLAVFFISLNISANFTNIADDTDLSAPLPLRYLKTVISTKLTPDKLTTSPIDNNKVEVVINYTKENGQSREIIIPPFNIKRGRKTQQYFPSKGEQVIAACSSSSNKDLSFTYEFSNKYFKIKNQRTYSLSFTAKCGQRITLDINHDSPVGQVLSIWDISAKAVKKFKSIGKISFWNQAINIKWPGAGDYYSWGTINITRGDYWDVVGHELGHAIYDLADLGIFGGGAHRIDQCYTKALALSEGWASYFSAWLSIDRSDNDAQFEYMVKRRAPLKFENIPGDVCAGETNEWRVTGFFWDLFDLNIDGENSAHSFKMIWENTFKRNFKSTSQAANHFISKGMDPVLVNIVWKNNFLRELD